MNIVDLIRRVAAKRPERPALLVDRKGETERITYAELVGNFEAHAKRLREAGIVAGDRCGLVAKQGAAFVERQRLQNPLAANQYNLILDVK